MKSVDRWVLTEITEQYHRGLAAFDDAVEAQNVCDQRNASAPQGVRFEVRLIPEFIPDDTPEAGS